MKLKTKKILMLISTTLVFIIDLIYAFSIYSGIISLESFSSDISISNNSQVIFLGICALLNLVSIFLIFKNLLLHKKKLIVLNIIQFLFGNIFNIVSGIFNIILLSIKTKDIEQANKAKKELPNYVKTKNIASNIFLHSSWNFIAVIALIITKLI